RYISLFYIDKCVFIIELDHRTTRDGYFTYGITVSQNISRRALKMGCSVRGGSYGGHYGGSDGCVKDTVKRILDAQQRVTDNCTSSCDSAIDDLLSPERHHRPHRYDTIPFMLYTKDCVKPFVGSGFTSWLGSDAYRRGNYRCVESPIFRVNGFKKGNDDCVILELLEPIKGRGGHDRPRLDGDGDSNTIQYKNECGCSI